MARSKKSDNNATAVRKTAIYIRVSTTYQVDKDSLPMQRKDLIAYSELILGIPDYEVFEDAGYSGKNTDRPAFQEMMKRIRRHEFSHVLVWKIDRISRNLMDFSNMYEELKSLRVTFVSKNEQFDTSTAVGGAMLKIILVFAELERNMTSERVTATMISRATQGQWNGGRIPFGYNYDPATMTFSINEDEAKICRLLKDDYLKNKSLIHTCRLLNEREYKTRSGSAWSPATVWIIASSPFYAGIYRYNRYKGTENRTENPEDEWIMVSDHHPAIFSVEEYEQMCALRESNSRLEDSNIRSRDSRRRHIFLGICYCGKCGSRMVASPGRILSDGYHTTTYSCPKHRNTKDCDNKSVNDLIVGEFVINYILNIINAKKSFSEINSVSELQKRLLSGSSFSDIDSITDDGLHTLYDILSRYPDDGSFVMKENKSRKRRKSVNPEAELLRKEKDRQERAMQRLQDLYLYSESALSEKDYILRKAEISSRLDEIHKKLGIIASDSDRILTDEEFIEQASHLLISSWLQNKEYIYYRNLASSVSSDVLHSYMESVIDNIQVADGKITCIVFKNGLTNIFNRKD